MPVSFWLIFFQSNKKNNWSRSFLLTSFWLGVLSSLLAVFLEIYYFEKRVPLLTAGSQDGIELVWGILSGTLPIAVIEEFSKGLVVVWAIFRKKILSLQNGLMMGVLAGLSFAVTENGIYFARFLAAGNDLISGGFWQVVFLRFLFSTSAHIIYSGLLGYFLAEFLSKETAEEKISAFLKATLIPIAIHTSFNSFLETAWGWLIFPIVLGGLLVIFFLYSKKGSATFFIREGGRL